MGSEMCIRDRLVAEAVYARIVSSEPERRQRVSDIFGGSTEPLEDVTVDDIETSLYASKIISYAQGFRLLDRASEENDWDLDLGLVASLWRAGCIIRARFLEDITDAYRDDPDLPELIEQSFFADALTEAQTSWRKVVRSAIEAGIPAPASVSYTHLTLPTIYSV